MDLKTIDKKIKLNSYQTPEDFEYDVTLIFKNCEFYNVPKKNTHIVQRSKFCAKVFRKMYAARIKAFEVSGGKKIFTDDKKDKKEKKRPELPSASEGVPHPKKAKTEIGSTKKSIGVKISKTIGTKSMHGKSPTTTPLDLPNPAPPPRSKSPKPSSIKKTTPKTTPRTVSKAQQNQDAIAQIKKQFTLRDHKELETWESGCIRFLVALKRHAWIAAVRPKFIFDVPVPILFPQINDEYTAKIKNPMDLTTAECKLLQGDIYNVAEEFVTDVALVFANAVIFNQAGREEGEPMSCAYFDASRHLLRYSRWLSLEHLSPYLSDSSKSDTKQTGPLHSWKLTSSNRKDSLEEMESMVLMHPIDKSEEGDKYTWMETECEKLLKSLRHQSDLKHMTYFISTKYPDDYLSYIKNPMDWASCQKRVQQRKYDTFGEIVEDLRLIFQNALNYNARHKEIDSESGRVSQRAYDSALLMSEKLEVAITRMLLLVSDRIEREKIDQSILERETEAAERAELERLKIQMRSTVGTVAERMTRVETVTITSQKRLSIQRRHYDEEPTHEQTQIEALMQQKVIARRQQKALLDMDNLSKVSKVVGANVFANLKERSNAILWAKDLSEKIRVSLNSRYKLDETTQITNSGTKTCTPSMVLSDLTKIDRPQIKIKLHSKRKVKKKRKNCWD